MNVVDDFCTSKEASALIDTFPPDVIRRRSATLHASFPFVRHALADWQPWHERVAKATGLPLEGMPEPAALVAYRPGETWVNRHTAFDLQSERGRCLCATLNNGHQRYAEAQVFLTAPWGGNDERGNGLPPGGSLTFGRQTIEARVGRLVWWLAADDQDRPLPEAAHSIAPVVDDWPWAWVLMFRWRRPAEFEAPTREQVQDFRVSFAADASGSYVGASTKRGEG